MSDLDESRPEDEITRLDDDEVRAGIRGGGSPEPSDHLRRLGDFELLRELGRGGMGVVYEARQVSLKRRVALKVLPPAMGLSPQARQRFEREAQAAAKLHHTNIVPVHAIGEYDGHHYYAMDLIEGQSLDHVLRGVADQGSSPLLDQTVTRAGSELPKERAGSTDSTPATTSQGGAVTSSLGDASAGSRPWFDAVARLIAEVADGLDYAHGRGVIHRDIKPANLMLSSEGRLCITDFGLARIVQEPGMTVSGSFLGTPAYMSPEQIAAGRMKLDHRTDVYSLGAVLYEMLTLQRPFPGDSREEVIGAIMTKEPRAPRKFNGKIPQDLETICLKALEKDPDRRYPTAGAFADDLRRFLGRGVIAAKRTGPLRRAAKYVRTHPLAATLATAIVVIGALGALAWSAAEDRARQAALGAIAAARYEMAQGNYSMALERVETAVVLGALSQDARILRASLLLKLNRPEDAIALARELVAEDPRAWQAHLILATAGRYITSGYGEHYNIPVDEHVAAVERYAPDTAEAHYLRATLADSPAEAVSHLDNALRLNPGHVDSLVLRAARRANLRDYPGAIADADRLIAARPSWPRGYAIKGWCFFELNDVEEALHWFGQAVQVDPSDPMPFYSRSRIYLDLGRREEALEDRARAVELRPEESRFRSALATVLWELGRREEALIEARRAVELAPDDPRSYKTLVDRLVSLGLETEARDCLDRSLELVRRLSRNETRSSNLRTAAGDFWALRDHRRALELADEAVEAAPGDWNNYSFRARMRKLLDDPAGAEADMEKAWSLETDGPWEAYARADFWGSQGRIERALEDCAEAIDRARNSPEPYRLRGSLLMGEKRYEEALEVFDHAIALAPKWGVPHLEKGRIFNRTERFEDALAELATALELDSGDKDTRWEQAQALLRLGREDEAFVAIDTAIEEAPHQASVYERKARALFWLGRVREASRVLDEAIEVEPRRAWTHAVRGHVLAFLPGRCDDAMEALAKAHELEPLDPGIANALAWSQVTAVHAMCHRDFEGVSALERARRAVKLEPRTAWYQVTLGFALYRNGDFDHARKTFGRALELETFPAVSTLFGLTMSEWAVGRRAEAQRHFARAVTRMKETFPRRPDSVQLQDEVFRLFSSP